MGPGKGESLGEKLEHVSHPGDGVWLELRGVFWIREINFKLSAYGCPGLQDASGKEQRL